MMVISSCDGRKSSQQALKEAIVEFQQEVPIEVDEYFPSEYFESYNDTILDNGYRILIKTVPDLENDVTLTKIKDTVNFQKHYRNFKIEIKLETDTGEFIKEHFTKERINYLVRESHTNYRLFSNEMVLKALNVNYLESTSEAVIFDLLYHLPETDKTSELRLSLSRKAIIITESNNL
ncbi:hypothetical protein [Winogradskyella aurantiaca]|uniref:hypothetical protein n=1 Tax=Winogradskyella aurantiaca TaxID=2219558 RepID=UPI0013001E1A|nr:hypothetical protein [Winogradskyella aurantiaca]